MDIYENIVIGNFLYGLGFQIGAGSAGKPHAMAVNLLQQTPLDKPLGDVLIEGASVFRLIEFKRLRNSSIKERAKHWHIREILNSETHLSDIAMRSHWYVETELSSEFHSDVRPYLHLHEKSRNRTIEAFIQDTAREALSKIDDVREGALFHEYIGHLLRIIGYSGEGSGAFVFTASGNGTRAPRFVAVRDIRDLAKSNKQVMDAYRAADLAQQLEIETPEQEQTLTRSRGRSRGRSWSLSRERDDDMGWGHDD